MVTFECKSYIVTFECKSLVVFGTKILLYHLLRSNQKEPKVSKFYRIFFIIEKVVDEL
jgi:hypothetical protein